MAKDFTKQAQASIYDAVMPQGTQAENEAQAVLEAQEEFKTQGKRGMQLPRMNMAFTPSNYDFIKVMAAIRGQSMTAYVNAVLEAERERNGDKYQAAKALVDSIDE